MSHRFSTKTGRRRGEGGGKKQEGGVLFISRAFAGGIGLIERGAKLIII